MSSKPDPKPYTTRRLRLKGFNYTTPGYYFITICQQDRRNLFATIDRSGHHPSPAGEMVKDVTLGIAQHFNDTVVDRFVVMPNHVHLLLGLNLTENKNDIDSAIDVVQWWKTQTTNRYGWGVKNFGWPRYQKSLWQEGYHDRITRTQQELEYIQHYIEQNPRTWFEDTFYEDWAD